MSILNMIRSGEYQKSRKTELLLIISIVGILIGVIVLVCNAPLWVSLTVSISRSLLNAVVENFLD